MKWNKTKSYGIFLLVVTLGLSFVLSVNRTQARYNSTAVWNTVVSYKLEPPVTSNCLSQGQRIILLGDFLVKESRKITFDLTATQEASDALKWTCNNEECLQVGMQVIRNGVTKDVAQGETIELQPNQGATVVMTLTTNALDEPRAEIVVDVVVSYGDLSGRFRVTLPEIPEEEYTIVDGITASSGNTEPTEPEETEPQETEPEETETQGTEPEGTEPEGGTAPTEPEDATVPTELEETVEIIIPGSGSETVTAGEEATLLNTGSEDSVAESESSEPSLQSESDSSAGIAAVDIKTLQRFDPASILPVYIENLGSAQRIVLGLVTRTVDTNFQLLDFPAFTCYSWNSVNYMLYYSGQIKLDVSGQRSATVLLDFSDTNINGKPLIGVQSYENDTLVGQGAGWSISGTYFAPMEIPRNLELSLNNSTFFGSDESRSFTIEFPPEWIEDGVEIEYSLEWLCSSKDGMAYKEVDLTKGAFAAEYVSDGQDHYLKVSMAEEPAPAGIYRLNMRFSYLGICFGEVWTPFWVHYS